MSMLEQTLPASFRGVPFLVNRASTSGGIKNAKHRFPNSNNQVIEGLGTQQDTHVIQAFITNNPEVDDYQNKKNALIAVLKAGETGVLIHPLYGTLNNMKATTWNIDEDFAELGTAKFTITFEVDLDQSVPEVESNTLSQVVNAGEGVVESVTEDIGDSFAVNFSNNISDSIDQINSLVDEFQDNVAIFSIAADQINTFTNQLSGLANNVVQLITAPLELGTSIQNLFQTTAAMFVTLEASLEVMVQFFGFGDDDVEIQPTTASRIERIKNRELIKEAVQIYALAQSYQLASQISFSTIEEQQEVANTLEAQYDKVISSVTIPTLSGTTIPVGVNLESKSLLTDQRIAVEGLFDDNRVTLGRIITVFSHLTSARLLSYKYYGDSQSGESIAVLNNFKDTSFIEGDLEIVTS